MPVDVTIEISGLFAIHESRKNEALTIFLLRGPDDVPHDARLAIPSSGIRAITNPPSSAEPRVILPGTAETHLFLLTGETEIAAAHGPSDTYDLERLLRLRDSFPGGGDGSSPYEISSSPQGVVAVVRLNGGRARTFATDPFRFHDVVLSEGGSVARRVDNVVEWEGRLEADSLNLGSAGVSLLADEMRRLSMFCVPSSGTTADDDLKHYTAAYGLLATPPPNLAYPQIPAFMGGPVLGGYPRCIPPPRL